jgi:Glycosyl transferase family 2
VHKFLDNLGNHIKITNGRILDVNVNLYAIIRDEMFNLPAFFSHYRDLGVQQFLVLDDGSVDGSSEFLCKQPDCVVLTSDIRFGSMVDSVALTESGNIRRVRWGKLLKLVIPNRFLRNRYALYVDADEFLILPEQVGHLSDMFAVLRSNEIDCVAANLVEFYPRGIAGLEGRETPLSFTDLVTLYPYFDARCLIEVQEGQQPIKLSRSASARLFHRYWTDQERTELLRKNRIDAKTLKSESQKIPILRWREGVWLSGSHKANVPPTSKAILTLAHFKFTCDFRAKIARSLRWRSHASKGRKYLLYNALLEKMEGVGGQFLGEESAAYTGPSQLQQLGLLKWGL